MTAKITPQVRLIEFIYEKHGGTTAVARKLKISKQLVSYWKTVGEVPIHKVRKVAEILGVPIYALCWKTLRVLYAEHTPEFKVVRKECYEKLRHL